MTCLRETVALRALFSHERTSLDCARYMTHAEWITGENTRKISGLLCGILHGGIQLFLTEHNVALHFAPC